MKKIIIFKLTYLLFFTFISCSKHSFITSSEWQSEQNKSEESVCEFYSCYFQNSYKTGRFESVEQSCKEELSIVKRDVINYQPIVEHVENVNYSTCSSLYNSENNLSKSKLLQIINCEIEELDTTYGCNTALQVKKTTDNNSQVKESTGKCDYPWQRDSAGRKCGKRAASVRSGGRL